MRHPDGFQFLVALDQLINTLIPNGYADETLSSRATGTQLLRRIADGRCG